MGGLLMLLAYLLLGAGTYLAFAEAPEEAYQGQLYRLIYIHVPCAWMTFLAYTGMAVTSALYLWKRQDRWDRLASSSAEAGLVFNAITLLTGAIWGKPVWGVWWTWDARLTTTLILLFIFLGYMLLRAFSEDPERRARFSAVYALIGFFDIPLIHFSVKWWRTLHQGASFGPGTEGLVGKPIMILVLLNFHAFILLYASWMVRRTASLKKEAAP